MDLRKIFIDVPPGEKCFGVVGWPLDYSLSPAMHNAAFSFLGFPGLYRTIRVSPEDWDVFAMDLFGEGGRRLGGINVTIPYKEKILSLSVMEKGTVVECRAANTLVREQKGWSAHNTDGPGFLDDLKEHHISWKGKSVVLLGAGGAARGVLFSLGNHAGSISLINRSRDRALSLAEDFRARGGRAKVTVGAHIEESLSSADLLVNATSVGLKEGDPSPVPETCLRPELSVYDMIYHRETALVKASRDAGAIAVGGLGMLVNQGALSFELWFQEDLKKVKYDPRVLRQIMGDAARAALKGRNSQ